MTLSDQRDTRADVDPEGYDCRALPSDSLVSRAEGLVLASALGDALGAGYEFASPPQRGTAAMIGGGLGDFAPGEWTDDTSMALSLLTALAGAPPTPPLSFGPLPRSIEDVLSATAEGFMVWFSSSPPDIGIQTSAVLSAATSSSPLALTQASSAHQLHHPDSAGNGALMRTHPLALSTLSTPDLLLLTRRVASLTHAHPLASDACVLWVLLCRGALRTGVHQDPSSLLSLTSNPTYWAERFAEVDSRPFSSFTPNGFTVSALQAAWASISACDPSSDSFVMDVLHTAVSIGNDTDTIAAIAGAYAGALKGSLGLPREHLEILHGYPGLSAPDLSRLAIRATRGDDPTGWPAASRLLPYYAHTFDEPAYRVSIPEDPGFTIGSVAALPLLQEDAVVSLCRVGLEERTPHHTEIRLVDRVGANDSLKATLLDAAQAVDFHRSQDRSVFLHCVAGRSRTAAVASVYLAHRLGITPLAALATLRRSRPELDPNSELLSTLASLSEDDSWRW